MRNAVNIQQTNIAWSGKSKRQSLIITLILWTVQVLLALLFLSSGIMKLITSNEALMAQMMVPLPVLFVRFIGVIECAGALGLILPGLLRIKPWLTPLAACGLVIEMIGATVVTLLGGGAALALMPLVTGLLCVAIAYGRRSWGRA